MRAVERVAAVDRRVEETVAEPVRTVVEALLEQRTARGALICAHPRRIKAELWRQRGPSRSSGGTQRHPSEPAMDDPAARCVHGLARCRKARPPRVLGELDEGGLVHALGRSVCAARGRAALPHLQRGNRRRRPLPDAGKRVGTRPLLGEKCATYARVRAPCLLAWPRPTIHHEVWYHVDRARYWRWGVIFILNVPPQLCVTAGT